MSSTIVQATISNQGLNRITAHEEKNFTFIVGSCKYYCTRSQALFVSGRVAQAVLSDPTITCLENSTIKDPDAYFRLICDVYEGSSLSISEANLHPLLSLCDWLDNPELLSALHTFESGLDPLSISNVIDRLVLKSSRGVDFTCEAEFISSNFSKFDLSSFRCINSTIFERIVSSESLRLMTEDSLLNVLCSLGYFELFCYVECLYLSSSAIDTLLNSISISSLNSEVWSSICRRLRCSVGLSAIGTNSTRFVGGLPSGNFPFADDPFGGILSHLSSICSGNVHKCGLVNITCSSTSSNQCWQVADSGWTDFWTSTDQKDSWICFDFKSRSVQLQHYSLKAASIVCYMTDWVIEGSNNDGATWTEIDNQHTDSLIGSGCVKTFACASAGSSTAFRLVRWRMTDQGKLTPGSARCCNQAKLSGIEFFGFLLDQQ
jgi:hypothetical protein